MILSDYVTGTITLTNGSAAFTGTGTGWLAGGFQEGDTIFDVTGATEYMGVISTITADGAGTLTKVWEGPTLAAVPYRMRYQPDGSRVTAQARQLIELLGNGNVLAFSTLDGTAGNLVPMFTGAGAMALVPKTDLVSGAFYNVQVSDLAGRAAYDTQPGPAGTTPGYAVLVADVGDGRSAIYSKLSDTSADWSAPAYVTGPIGSTGPTGPVSMDWKGAYSGATTYAINDVATFNGSTFRKLTTAAAGTAPSGATPPVDTADWEVLAAKGADGLGTGDVVGPASSLASEPAFFDGVTGKLIKSGSGLTAAEKGKARAIIEAEILSGTRNRLDNPDFDIWQRGTTFPGVSGTVQFGPDRWSAFQTGANVNWDRVAFTPGQTDVPGEPEFFGRVTAAGGTGLSIGQRMEGVRTYAGKRVTVTGYIKGNAVRTCDVALRQQFGSGGSATVATVMGSVNILNGTWTKFSFTAVLPSISGKTIGTGNSLGFYFENFNVAGFQIDIAHISVVLGDATAEADPCPYRDLALIWAKCRRFYRIVRFRGLVTAGAASEFLSMVFPAPDMRATPTTEVLGTDSLTNIGALTTDVSDGNGGVYVQVYGSSSASGSCAFTATRGLIAEL